MKIALNASFWQKPNTGSGQYLQSLLSALLQRDFENDYCLIAPQRPLENVPPCVDVRYAVSSLSENFAKLWFEQVAFVRACQRERADLAHVPYFASPLFPRARTIVTIHDLIPMLLPLYRGSVLVRAYTQLVAMAARRADAIIADSECSQRDIVRHLGIDASRVHVVYLAADARYRPADNAQIEIVRQKYSLPRSAKYLLYLGGYDQRKNVRVIIQAFAQARDLYASGYRLALAGTMLGKDSEFFPDPRRIAREANLPDDAICFLGWVDEADKPALYSSATAFLFASIYEGFGLPPLEAMACGTPVICSNTSSLPEIVGKAGITIDPNDVDAWANTMRMVATDSNRRFEMSQLGIEQAKKFSWEHTAEETLMIYRTIKGGNSQ